MKSIHEKKERGVFVCVGTACQCCSAVLAGR